MHNRVKVYLPAAGLQIANPSPPDSLFKKAPAGPAHRPVPAIIAPHQPVITPAALYPIGSPAHSDPLPLDFLQLGD